MTFEAQYRRRMAGLIADVSICSENRKLFAEFFAYEEYKLKRQNGLRELDEASYKTLCYYVTRLKNVNGWFKNKPWRDLTKEDIKRVYDDLEDGVIKNARGKPFEDPGSYYRKVFRSKPFRLAGKDTLAREVIEFSTSKPRQVRYVDEEAFKTLLSVLSKPTHLFLFWLAWDVGENINTLLSLRKRDFQRRTCRDTQEPEYLVNFPRELLKRSRRLRGEATLYPETVRYGDMVLANLGEDDPVFPFGHRQALKILKRTAEKTGARSMPHGEGITWKDFRSGMACHLLRMGWSLEEINARLGHVPSSKAIDAYISHLALSRHSPKKRLHEGAVEHVQNRLAESQHQQKLFSERLRQQGEHTLQIEAELARTRRELTELRKGMEAMLATLVKS